MCTKYKFYVNDDVIAVSKKTGEIFKRNQIKKIVKHAIIRIVTGRDVSGRLDKNKY